MVYEEDFKTERRDREVAAGKYDEECSRLQASLSEARQETVSQKKQLALLSEELEAERRRNQELTQEIERRKVRGYTCTCVCILVRTLMFLIHIFIEKGNQPEQTPGENGGHPNKDIHRLGTYVISLYDILHKQ